jgi:hypothetical protein
LIWDDNTMRKDERTATSTAVALASAASALCVGGTSAQARDVPTRPIRLIVGAACNLAAANIAKSAGIELR